MQPKRVTQRDIALAAGVTRPTVSLALRRHPSIPQATRDRILAIADKLGYVPDPVLSALASYRWPSSPLKRAVMSIALVELLEPRAPMLVAYANEVRRGILARATALGYAASVFKLGQYEGNLKHMLRVLRSRGVNGIILLPAEQSISLDPAAGWEGFSVVTATTSVLAPRFHQVAPNQLYNMTALLERLHHHGHRRIGAIFSEAYEQRTTHSYSMALAWFGHRDRILILPGDATPEENDRRVSDWLRRQPLDLVFVPDADGIARIRRPKKLPRGVGDQRLVSHADFIEQFPDLIGTTAVRVLGGLMHDNETGIPSHPQITTIDGEVRENLIPPGPGA